MLALFLSFRPCPCILTSLFDHDALFHILLYQSQRIVVQSNQLLFIPSFPLLGHSLSQSPKVFISIENLRELYPHCNVILMPSNLFYSVIASNPQVVPFIFSSAAFILLLPVHYITELKFYRILFYLVLITDVRLP